MPARRAFTLVEILFSLAISLIVFGAVIAATVAFTQNRHLESAADTAMSYLRTAVMRSMQGEENLPHGVSFAGGQMTLFRGESYASRDQAGDTVWELPSYIEVTGLTEVVFSKQAADPSATGDISISNGRRTVTITVYPTGAISQP